MSQVIKSGIENFDALFKEIGRERVFFVCDEAFAFLPDAVKNVYYDRKDKFVLFNEFTPNPLYEQVCKGVELFRKNECDVILAIGGGSAIDVAKCVKLYCKMDDSENYLRQECRDSGVPLIAIPTTAGTGSESTRFAVIYFEGKKQSVAHESIVPNYVVLEPSVLKTLPPRQKKATMLDALCQGIESWWSVNSTDESKGYSKIAVDKIVANYKKYIFENDDAAAREIMTAANYAGRAINITQTTAAHAMSYKITSLYKIPHGAAVAVCLPEVWEYMLAHPEKCIDPRGIAYLTKTLSEISVDLDWFKALLAELEAEYPTATDRENEISVLAESVNPVRLKNFPTELTADVLRKMYERIVK